MLVFVCVIAFVDCIYAKVNLTFCGVKLWSGAMVNSIVFNRMQLCNIFKFQISNKVTNALKAIDFIDQAEKS